MDHLFEIEEAGRWHCGINSSSHCGARALRRPQPSAFSNFSANIFANIHALEEVKPPPERDAASVEDLAVI